MQQHATLRRVLRRFSNSKCFLEGFLEGATRMANLKMYSRFHTATYYNLAQHCQKKLVQEVTISYENHYKNARRRGRTLPRGALGTFWKPPSQNPSENTLSEPFLTAKPITGPLLRKFLRTLPQSPSQNLLRTLLRTLCCRTSYDLLGVHPNYIKDQNLMLSSQ